MIDQFAQNMELVIAAYLNDETKYKPYDPLPVEFFNSLLATKVWDTIKGFLVTCDHNKTRAHGRRVKEWENALILEAAFLSGQRGVLEPVSSPVSEDMFMVDKMLITYTEEREDDQRRVSECVGYANLR